jgi:hypothetical protein
LDGVGYVTDHIGLSHGAYETYHHVWGHGLTAGILIAVVCYWFSGRRAAVFFLCLVAFHLHLMGDLAGSRGPDGHQWPILYLFPFSDHGALTWAGQWELSSWRNSALGVAFFAIAVALARIRGVTFFELISSRLDQTVVVVGLKRRFFKRIDSSQ